MKIAVAHPSLNRGGGAEKVCLTAVKALSRSGHSVRLATIDKTDWHFLEERFGKLFKPHEEVYLMENAPVKGRFSQAAFTLSCFLPELFHLRMGEEYDMVVNTYGDLVNSIADISYINALPVRVTYHYSESGFSNSVIWRFIAKTYDFSLKAVDKFFTKSILLANSIFIRNIVKQDLNRNAQVVYPPVNVETFSRARRGSDRENRVVTVSRLRAGKHLELIPRIAKLVKTAKFTIVGLADQASQDTIRLLTETIESSGVEDRVKLLINQPFPVLLDVLSSAKVFLHTQPLEAFGMAVVEAMAAGCVPVVPKAGGPWFDTLDREQGKYGYAYTSVKEAAEKTDRLLNDERLRVEISGRAFERSKYFDCSFFERRIVKTIHQVAAGNRR